MSEKYSALAKYLIENVGGVDNIINITHCATRVRFKLRDESLANTVDIKRQEGVLTVIQDEGQYQVVIGVEAEDAYNAVVAAADLKDQLNGNNKDNGKGNQKKGLLSKIFKK